MAASNPSSWSSSFIVWAEYAHNTLRCSGTERHGGEEDPPPNDLKTYMPKAHLHDSCPVSCLSDYRPVAPIIIKCFKSLVVMHIKTQLPPAVDPLQFVYHPNRSTDNAIAMTLQLALTQDRKDPYIRMLFIDISSTFKTIIPQHLIEKLGQNTSLCNWILNFLTGRP
ncbi:hypothetical protein QTP70_024680 [Hemibagrus guttatus]|uniref:Reverse transcriptase domain-containing protein n=1 Tax=Hemibagrus guttatus TaxID=175788 RepID=A0AAE0RJB5_9TELE|nr:hypothetical protein QTP70_024680 [Hemibagrus guttatus]KAK3574298.1 hypothetical protein QTP86_004354 [Hemibagrus guttatus]